MAAQPLFDDGVHFVRNAHKNDRHPLRFVVTHHKATDSKRNRHVDTLVNAIEVAKTFTKAAIVESTNDKVLFEGHGKPAPHPVAVPKKNAHTAKPNEATTPKPKKGALPSFASSYFTCKIANPAAQVWECTAMPGERKSAGRKHTGGKEPTVAQFKHRKGECAVLLWQVPVRDCDGHIKVFTNWIEADEHAQALYREAYEEDGAITWRSGDVVIQRLTDVEICFDPSESVHKPFYLVINKHGFRKPYYQSFRPHKYATASKNADGSVYQPPNPEAAEAMDFNRKLRAMENEEYRGSGLTEVIARFKTPWEAEKKAIELEITYCGNGDLYS